ncbi:biotin/lipoyl-binding carrier protein [Candidatus Poriferisodalis sp.]|uniref:biotin/lipoyl-binding carrier protein n=1 Tax=Candidatus Poriferisodalis sp. TaxID=3101277 RepID=UPI003B012FDC
MDVRAELTATVWKVVAEVGAAVSAGDELVILESMKMEIPVAAPEAGTLAALNVNEGDAISEGDVLAVIETS